MSSDSKALKAEKSAPVLAKTDEAAAVDTEATKVDEGAKPAKAAKAPRKARRRSTAAKKDAGINSKLGLKVSAGLNMGTLYPLKKRRNVIGRRVDAAFPVQDERASRDHASIDYKKGSFVLTDLGSTNGTFLNNKVVKEPTFIKEGDHIRVGSSVFLVELMNERSPEMVERWSTMTRIVPRTQVLNRVSVDPAKPIASPGGDAPRWTHLNNNTFVEGHQKHLHQARLFGVALSILMVAAAILTSLA